MRALVIGASGQVGAALLRALRARGHEATGTYGAPRRARASCRSTSPITPPSERPVADGAARLGLLPRRAEPRGLLRGASGRGLRRQPRRPARRRAGGRRAPAPASSTTPPTTSSTAWTGPIAEDDPPAPARRLRAGASARASRRCWARSPRALVVRTSVVYGPERQEKNFVYQLIRACRERQGLPPRGGPAREPAATTPTWPRPPWSCCERELRGIWHLAGADVLDRYGLRAPGLPRVRAWTPPASRPRRPPQLGQKAPRPLDGGLRIAKAQAQLRDATPRRRGGAPRDARGARGAGRPTPERPLTSPGTYGTSQHLAVVLGR